MLDRVIADYSDQFDDRRHLSSNQTQARRLCGHSGLGVADFVQVLYEAGARTASHVDRIERIESDGIHRLPRVRPYFFGVVKGVLRERGCNIPVSVHDTSASVVQLDALAAALGKRVKPATARRWLAGAAKLRAEYFKILQHAMVDVAGPDVKIEVESIANQRPEGSGVPRGPVPAPGHDAVGRSGSFVSRGRSRSVGSRC